MEKRSSMATSLKENLARSGAWHVPPSGTAPAERQVLVRSPSAAAESIALRSHFFISCFCATDIKRFSTLECLLELGKNWHGERLGPFLLSWEQPQRCQRRKP